MRIIIAIDIIGGKCVRLTKGDFGTVKFYNEDPLEVARQVEDHGIRYLHIVDLDGAKNKHVINYRIVERIASKTSLTIDFGGGIRSEEDLKIAFNSGASQVTCGSVAAGYPDLFLEWLGLWGKEKIILGADCKERRIAIEGWTESKGPDIIEYITGFQSKGIKYIICTDIDKDGMLEGPSTGLYREILEIGGISLIASGGISSVDDILNLSETGCEGAIIGKALYEGILNLKELSRLC
jgi:phosphoribosylformimino-5-aminoimidazole carboxamide ribotide isomerase